MNKWILLLIIILISSVSFSQEVKIGSIYNKIEIGPLSGNRDLAFGVKNILEEVLQEKGYNLLKDAKKVVEVDILYFDVKGTNMQLALYANNTEVTEIIAKGRLLIDGKEMKVVVSKGKATAVSTSTLIIDKGGKFSQSNVSSALKKVCEQLIDKLKL